MSGASSRRKGASAEREFFALLNAEIACIEPGLGLVYQRNLLQTRIGGADSQGNGPLAIEVKRCEKLSLPAWIAQAKEQAQLHQFPVLAYRQSQQDWTVAVLMTVKQLAEFHMSKTQ